MIIRLRNTNRPGSKERAMSTIADTTEPVSGPLCLGHSCHFGLGLFAALPEDGPA